jgi:hypothetical protein
MKSDLIPRRTVLKGLGAVMALPWLEAMGLQTGWAAGNTPTKNVPKTPKPHIFEKIIIYI